MGAVSERERHELYLGLEEKLGTERADTMMSLLPPVGWADVASKADLDHLESRIEAALQRELRDQLFKIIWAMLASQMTLAAIILTAVAMIR